MAANTTDPLNTALRNFESSLSTQQRTDLRAVNATPDANAVIAFTAQIDEENASRRSRGVANRLYQSLESIQQFTSIVDTFVQANPQIAALVWGSFKVAILIAQKFASIDKLSEWFMKWGSYCPRFSAYQDLYAGSLRLQNALCLFYATLVQLCTKSVHVLQRTGTAQFIRAFNLFGNELDPLEHELQRYSEKVQEEIKLASEQAAYQERQLQKRERSQSSKFRGKFNNVQEAWEIQRNEREMKSRKRSLLNKLSMHDHIKPLRRERTKRCGKTGVWLSKSKEYIDWLADPKSSLFWLSGIPGAGKTVLTAAIIDDLSLRRQPSQTGVSFFFCEYDNQTTLLTRTILGCLARQYLTVGTLSDSLEAKIRALIEGTLSDVDALKGVLQESLGAPGIHFIVIDGFDECSLQDRDMILEVFKRITETSSSVLKIILSSRQDVVIEIKQVFDSYYHKTMGCAELHTDIATYIEVALEEKISSRQLVVGDPNLLAVIHHALTKGAHGMFLWVSFQIADICDQTCDEGIHTVIKDLPRNLTETYERALKRISKSRKADIAQKVFRWVLAAKRPLSIEELGEAVVIKPGQRFLRPEQLINNVNQIVPWCGNLLVEDEEEHLVHFAHHTVKELLLSQRSTSDLQCFRFKLIDVDHEAGETCCTYLHLDNLKKQVIKAVHIEPTAVINASLLVRRTATLLKPYIKLTRSSKRRLEDFDLGLQLSSLLDTSEEMQQQNQHPFLNYARENWLFHTTTFSEGSSTTWSLFDHLVSTEEDLGIKKWSSTQLKQYLTDHSHWGLLAWKWNRYKTGVEAPDSALLLQELWCNPTYALQHERLLLLAAVSPFDRALATISQAGLWYNIDGAITTAAKAGDLGLLETILSVKTPKRYETPKPNINGALLSAARLGHVEIVTRLLAVQSINRSPDPIDMNAVTDAAKDGGNEVLALLLSNVKEETEVQRLLLVEAAATGDHAQVKALLEANVDVNTIAEGSTALQRAAKNNHFGIMHLLLEHQANVGAGAGTSSGTVLQEAVKDGRFEMVEMLCKASLNWTKCGDGEFGIRQPHIVRLYGVNVLNNARNLKGLDISEFVRLLDASDVSEGALSVLRTYLTGFGNSNAQGTPPEYNEDIFKMYLHSRRMSDFRGSGD